MQQTVLSDAAVFFTLVLGLSLLIERFFEVVKAIFDLIDSRYDLHRFWTKRAERTRDLLERRLHVLRYLSPEQVRRGLNQMHDRLVPSPEGAQYSVPTIAGDLVRAAAIRVTSKVLGVVIGIVLAMLLQLDVLHQWPSLGPETLPPLFPEILTLSKQTGQILTGIAIGLGAGPLHKIITTLERWRTNREAGGGA